MAPRQHLEVKPSARSASSSSPSRKSLGLSGFQSTGSCGHLSQVAGGKFPPATKTCSSGASRSGGGRSSHVASGKCLSRPTTHLHKKVAFSLVSAMSGLGGGESAVKVEHSPENEEFFIQLPSGEGTLRFTEDISIFFSCDTPLHTQRHTRGQH